MSKNKKIVEKIARELLEKLGFPEAEISSTQDEDNKINLQIHIPPEDSGLLIGFHGETIMSLQLIIGQMVAKKIGEWQTIIVNIGDYREKRKEALETMAFQAANRVKITNRAVVIPYLNSSERRLVHLILAGDEAVSTRSEGEGKQRRLIISPKSKNPTDEDKRGE